MTPRIADIQRATAEYFGLPYERLVGAHRIRKFVRPQQIAMYLARELTGKSLRLIASRFDQDHKAIVRGHDVIGHLLTHDAAIAKAIGEIAWRVKDDPRQITLPLVA